MSTEPQQTGPQKEHEWLHKLLGEWTYVQEAVMEPGKPPETFNGSESVRSLGGLWVLCEGLGNMPGGGEAKMLMTLGYDPQKKLYVGTFIGSMMTYLWLYEGRLEGNVLTLESEGPSFTEEGKLGKFRDVIEVKSDDHRTLTSFGQGPDGTWTQFMLSDYRRTK